ncbi:hypothetical protein EVAR_79212_1 [Eumeta japonica]|uniref:Histone-lysine N-methyltransferase SETMAR n=1 Tax=Eumeta variegata TaxID=151549 RepID=A0A4C1UT66_EUMVA|nr:hypothetical protein EVAR_79212_1 [Eumeta japonica]
MHPPYSPDLAPSYFHLFQSLWNSIATPSLGTEVCGSEIEHEIGIGVKDGIEIRISIERDSGIEIKYVADVDNESEIEITYRYVWTWDWNQKRD